MVIVEGRSSCDVVKLYININPSIQSFSHSQTVNNKITVKLSQWLLNNTKMTMTALMYHIHLYIQNTTVFLLPSSCNKHQSVHVYLIVPLVLEERFLKIVLYR